MAAADAMTEPGQRGTLALADRAVAKLARAAVLTVEGVAPASSTAGTVAGTVSGVIGWDLPRVDVARAGSRVDLAVDVASLWPRPAAEVACAVRAAVSTQLAELADLTTGAVAVAVVRVVRPAAGAPQRRRVR